MRGKDGGKLVTSRRKGDKKKDVHDETPEGGPASLSQAGPKTGSALSSSSRAPALNTDMKKRCHKDRVKDPAVPRSFRGRSVVFFLATPSRRLRGGSLRFSFRSDSSL